MIAIPCRFDLRHGPLDERPIVCPFILCVGLLATIAGEIIYIRALNMVIIVLNSEKVANELLKGRFRIYSNRPYMATRVLCVLFVFQCTLNFCNLREYMLITKPGEWNCTGIHGFRRARKISHVTRHR
jgi:hypothetical protein